MKNGHPHNRIVPLGDEHFVEAFNKGCGCVTLDSEKLYREMEMDLAEAGLSRPIQETHPHLFATAPLFLSRSHIRQIQAIIDAIDTVSRTDAWKQTVARWAPLANTPLEQHKGVFFGYDFHLGPLGPQLIEINTNAGGALFNAFLARAQRACCPPVEQALVGGVDPKTIEQRFMDMFHQEWHAHRPDVALQNIVIVDTKPEAQGMYPEFLLFQKLFQRHGLRSFIADPSELTYRDDALWLGTEKVDLVYNRLCDFYLEAPEHAALALAYRTRAAVITPHPHAYALYADKRNLTLLSNPNWLDGIGIDQATRNLLINSVPKTWEVTSSQAEWLWSQRKTLFFKPVTGYGSRAVYKGAKLTRRVWEEIIESEYVAQVLVEPGERRIQTDLEEMVLKADLRAYTYDNKIQFLAARLYRGQTTNMRTLGGGFAPVFTEGQLAASS